MKIKISAYLGCIAIAAAAAYALSLRNGFVWDDVLLVVHNDFIKGWKLLPQVFSKPLFYIANPAYQYYRPLQTVTYILDYSLWGLAPAGFHLSNILLHICVALLSFALVHAFSANARLAFWSSLLFAVHPVNTTVVCYVSSRADILLALFSACSLLLFLHARAWQLHVLSLAFFAAALLSKETALILPLCLVLAGEMRLGPGTGVAPLPSAQRRRRYVAYFLIALAYLFLRKSVVGVSTRILPQSYPGIGSIFAALAAAAASYVKFIFFPSGIHMLHTVPVAPGPGAFFPALPAVLAAIAALAALYRVQKFLFLWAGMFLLWMAPAISLAFRNPEYYNQGLAMAQVHWLYAALLGICVIFVFGIEKAGRFIGGRAAAGILGLCAVLLSCVSVAENFFWKDNLTFFTHTAGYVRKSATVFRNLGWIYLSGNDTDKALEAYSYALGLQKDAKAKAIAYKDLSNAYVYAGMPLEARNAALESVRLDPFFADGYAQLGKADALGHPGSGRNSWLKALELDPLNSFAFGSLLMLSQQDARLREDLSAFYQRFLGEHKGARFDDFKAYRALGLLRLQEGSYKEAALYLRCAWALNPYDIALNTALAVCYARKGEFPGALRYFTRALKLNPFEPQSYRNLSLLYESFGDTLRARMWLKKSASVNVFK